MFQIISYISSCPEVHRSVDFSRMQNLQTLHLNLDSAKKDTNEYLKSLTRNLKQIKHLNEFTFHLKE